MKKALGVPKRLHYESCNNMVYGAFMADIMRNLEVGLPDLLEDGIEMLIYVGEYDLICNVVGKFTPCRAFK